MASLVDSKTTVESVTITLTGTEVRALIEVLSHIGGGNKEHVLRDALFNVDAILASATGWTATQWGDPSYPFQMPPTTAIDIPSLYFK